MTKKRFQIEAIARDARNRILSRAVNSYTKTHPLQSHFATLANEPARIYLHAEILALLRAGERKVSTLTIINHSGKTLPFPCRVCQLAIREWGVKNVFVQSAQSLNL